METNHKITRGLMDLGTLLDNSSKYTWYTWYKYTWYSACKFCT